MWKRRKLSFVPHRIYWTTSRPSPVCIMNTISIRWPFEKHCYATCSVHAARPRMQTVLFNFSQRCEHRMRRTSREETSERERLFPYIYKSARVVCIRLGSVCISVLNNWMRDILVVNSNLLGARLIHPIFPFLCWKWKLRSHCSGHQIVPRVVWLNEIGNPIISERRPNLQYYIVVAGFLATNICTFNCYRHFGNFDFAEWQIK